MDRLGEEEEILSFIVQTSLIGVLILFLSSQPSYYSFNDNAKLTNLTNELRKLLRAQQLKHP